MSLIFTFVLGLVFLVVSVIQKYRRTSITVGLTSSEIIGIFGMLLMITSIGMGLISLIWRIT